MTRRRFHPLWGAAVLVATLAAATAARAQSGPSSTLRLESVIDSTSGDAIVAEIERADALVCTECVPLIVPLLDDPRQNVREAAAWWIARRPQRKQTAAGNAYAAIHGGDTDAARNAADVLGVFLDRAAIPELADAYTVNGALEPEARAHIMAALGRIGHTDADPTLSAAMATDTAPMVRAAAAAAWLEIRGQVDAAPVIALITDSDVAVRRTAAAVIGGLADGAGRVGLEARLADDADSAVRRNAAWALGQIGDRGSQAALEAALLDRSGLVRMTARLALRKVRQ